VGHCDPFGKQVVAGWCDNVTLSGEVGVCQVLMLLANGRACSQTADVL